MIERYTRKEMGRIWEDQNKYQKWLQVELAVCEALVKEKVIPRKAFQNIKKKARFDVKRILEIEEVVKHDVIAFLTAVGEHVGEDARFIHMGMTSSDVLDTALAIQLQEAADLIIEGVQKLLKVLKKKANQYKEIPMIGRTHGIHAEPMTFGLKMALWYDEMTRNLERMKRARNVISYGKISGAVGTFAHLSPDVEAFACQRCGLEPARISNQVLQRDRHAEYFTTLAILASSMEKIALEIRHLQRTEVREAEEYFSAGQKGSSAMPHKRNPILTENLCGLARVVRSSCIAALENIPLWHERDISHSSVERVIAPDSTILVDFMLHRLIRILEGLVIYEENMKKNLEITAGLIYSQNILLELAKKGLTREQAYELVQRNAMRVWEEEENFKELVLQDKEIMTYLSSKEVERCMDLNDSLRYVDTIFQRVFGRRQETLTDKEQ